MSTSGFVGIGTPEQFTGRYNHWDSYPTGLGMDVWTTVQRFLHDDRHLKGFAQRLLGFTDWRQMASGGRCEYCGQITGQPHSMSALILIPDDSNAPSITEYIDAVQRRTGISAGRAREIAAEEWPIIDNCRRTGYPDPAAQYHEHDARNPEESAITPENVDWLFIDWAYLVDPARQQLHVLVGCIETPITYRVEIIQTNGTWERHTKTRFTSAVLGSYDLLGPEPDWGAIETLGNAIRIQLETALADNPRHPLLDAVRARPGFEVWDQREAVSS